MAQVISQHTRTTRTRKYKSIILFTLLITRALVHQQAQPSHNVLLRTRRATAHTWASARACLTWGMERVMSTSLASPTPRPDTELPYTLSCARFHAGRYMRMAACSWHNVPFGR